MVSLESDKSYRELRREVTDKAFNVNLVNTVTTILAFGAAGLGLAAFSGASIALGLAAGGAALAAAVVGVFNFKQSHDLSLDYEELEMQRRSAYLEKLVGKGADKSTVLIADSQLDQNKRSDWSERVTTGDLARGQSAMEI